MESGIQMTLEMWMPEAYPDAIVGASDRLVKISASPEKEPVLKETDPLSLEKYLESLGKLKKKIDPNGLSMRMLRECSRQMGGADYLAILMEMDNLGYDAEWEDFNTSWFLPQNRERIYTLGHFRRFGSAKVFPITPTNGEDCVPIEIIGHRDGYRRNTQVFSPDGITETLSTCQGGGREHHTAVGVDVESSEDHPGMYVEQEDGCMVWAVWHEKYQCYIAIRKLTPKECFRLQGWSDDYFEKAEFVNSDSQLYKQAGNGVSVPVAEAIGKAISMQGNSK